MCAEVLDAFSYFYFFGGVGVIDLMLSFIEELYYTGLFNWLQPASWSVEEPFTSWLHLYFNKGRIGSTNTASR